MKTLTKNHLTLTTAADAPAQPLPIGDAYAEFLRAKVRLAVDAGFDATDIEVNPLVKEHQRDIIKYAIRGGRRAIFAAFGLGKSVMQIETLRVIQMLAGGAVLIVCPLGSKHEIALDAAIAGPSWADKAQTLGLDIEAVRAQFALKFTFIRTNEEFHAAYADGDRFFLTNYESVRDNKLDPILFTATSLDEASVLRSFGSQTYQTFLTLFVDVKYLFVATATPSPNRFKELIHYAGFLRIMDTGQALTRFFQRDSQKANNLKLYPHKEHEFFLWLASWAVFISKPSDLGYSDEGYDLPPLNVHWHEVATDHDGAKMERDGQAVIFRDAAMGLSQAAAEKRDSLPARVAKMQEILAADPTGHFLLWHDLEAERHAICQAVPSAVAVYGTQELDKREQAVIDFSNGKIQYLATKPEISGSGCNFQRHCHQAIFLGVGYKFNDFIQSVHRIYRFLQTKPCEIHIIYAESERAIVATLKEKWKQHELLTENMTAIVRKYGLNQIALSDTLTRSIGVVRQVTKGNHFEAANNDTVLEARLKPDDSVKLIVTSIPFSNHYEYTPSYLDFGHTENNDHFWAQMDFLTPELLRILEPGRLYCCHVKDRILFGNATGTGLPTVSPFHAEALFHGMKHGFDYIGMITVVTDVVRENNQTYRLGWTENSKDGTKMGVGSPEYILLFHKPQTDRSKGYADVPVVKSKADYTRARWQVDAHAFWRSSGDRVLTPDEMSQYGPDVLGKIYSAFSIETVYDYAEHIKLGQGLEDRNALPSKFMTLQPNSHDEAVWTDVNRMLTLNGNQTKKGLANHVCPLQFDIVDRLITRYSNEGDLVYDPFGGLGTVPSRAIKLGRKGACVELNPDYYRDSLTYLRAAEEAANMPSLFDFEKTEEEIAAELEPAKLRMAA